VECDRDGLLVEHSRTYSTWLTNLTSSHIHIRDSDSVDSQNACIASSPPTLTSVSNFPNGINLDRAVIVI